MSSRIASVSRSVLSAWLATIASSSASRLRHRVVLEHDPQPFDARRAERLAVRGEVRERHDGRAGGKPERVQARPHGGGIDVAEADHDLRLRGLGLRDQRRQLGHEIDRRIARRGQLLAQGLGYVAVPADNQDAGGGENVVIHTRS